MRVKRFWGLIRSTLLLVAIFVSATGTVYATTSSSSNYKVSETQFGGGATQQACSNQYCGQVSIGNISSDRDVGSSTASFEPITPGSNDPRLEMIIDAGSSNLGDISAESTASRTVIVRIQNYLNDGGYVLQILGDPPKTSSHTINPLSTPTASIPGTEQFGINVVANTSPNIGASPVQVPSSGVTFGEADEDYATANLFKYSSGDTVARSNAKTGRTDYTISMIFNISNATPYGNYKANYSAVAVPVY